MWFNLYDREAVQHKRKNSLKTQSMTDAIKHRLKFHFKRSSKAFISCISIQKTLYLRYFITHNDLGPIVSLLQRILQPSTLNFKDDVVSHKKAIELPF